jgi:hypothetical protein
VTLPRRPGDAVAALLLLAVAGLAAARGVTLGLWGWSGPGAGLLPLLAATMMLLCLGAGLSERPAGTTLGQVQRRRLATYLAALLALPVALEEVGYAPAIGGAVALLVRIGEGWSWRVALASAAGSVALIHLLFVRLLGVPLPKGALFG